MHAGHAHIKTESHLGRFRSAGDGRGPGRVRCGRQRQMSFASEQTGGGIQTNPAGPGDEHLAPGVQIGEVPVRPGWPIQRLDVGSQLHQIPRHKPCGQSQPTQDMHQQPG